MNGVKDLMTQAIRALKAGRKKEAYRFFSEVADLDRTNEDALLGKAGCSSDLDETILLLQKILAINPSNERAREGLEWAMVRRTAVSEASVGLVEEHEERSSAHALAGVREETEEVERKQRRADTSTTVAAVIVVLYGLYGFFSGIKEWVHMATWLAGFAGPHPQRSFSSLLFQIVWSVGFWGILGFILVVIAMSLLDSTKGKLRRLGVKQAGWLVPLILLFFSVVTGALSGVQDWVASSLEMGRIPGQNLLALVFDIVDSVALFAGIMFVGAMVVW